MCYFHPPEASMVAPVKKEASGDSRNTATAAISAGWASRPIATVWATAVSRGQRETEAYVDEGQGDAIVLRHLVSGQGAVGEVIGQAEFRGRTDRLTDCGLA
jgi:hypothetical protein